MTKTKLVVIFPGRNYSVDKPLLYYAGKVFENREYDVVRLHYNYKLKADKDDIPALIEEAKIHVIKALSKVDFSKYEDVVFISKSMGTALAGYAELYFNVKARHVYLTPVADALKYISSGKGIVVSGKEDKILDSRKLKIYCVEQDIALKQFEEVGHTLEHPQDMNKTFAVLMVIIRMYREF